MAKKCRSSRKLSWFCEWTDSSWSQNVNPYLNRNRIQSIVVVKWILYSLCTKSDCLLIATSICYFLFINVWQLLKAWVWILSDSPTWVFNLYILFFLIWKTVDRKCISIFLFSNVKSPKITIQTKCDIFWYTIFQPILNFENQSGLNFQNRVPNFRFRKSCFLGWQGPFCK